MAGETVITVVGNLTDDPELRFTPSGAAVAKFRIASTPRTLDRQSGEWKDGEPLFLACNIWRDAAEHVAESLQRGARVIVQGRLRQRSYETREGEKRTVYELEVDEIGPSLRYATAKVQRMSRSGGGAGGGGFGASNGGGRRQSAAQQWRRRQLRRPVGDGGSGPGQPLRRRHQLLVRRRASLLALSGCQKSSGVRAMAKAAALRKPKKKVNPLDKDGITYIDYKDTALLRKFISDRGKIRARRVTGVTSQQQRQIARAVKNAREMALLPYTATAR
jgi:single-strand DNA-binding protein